jgi:hypothetical protein
MGKDEYGEIGSGAPVADFDQAAQHLIKIPPHRVEVAQARLRQEGVADVEIGNPAGYGAIGSQQSRVGQAVCIKIEAGNNKTLGEMGCDFVVATNVFVHAMNDQQAGRSGSGPCRHPDAHWQGGAAVSPGQP